MFFLFLIITLKIFWLHWVFVAMCGLSLVVMHGLLMAVVSLVAVYRLSGVWGSVVVAHRLSCPLA